MTHLRQRSRCAPRKPSGWAWGGDEVHRSPGAVRWPTGHLSCSDLGQAQNAGPTESVPLWSTREPEPEQLRPGKCTEPRARFGQFPRRETWSLSSVGWEKTHTVSGSKPSVAQTL